MAGDKESIERINATVERLKQHPGEWRIILRDAYATRARPYQQRGCLTECRSTPKSSDKNQKYTIYAQWPLPPGGREP